MCWMLKVDGKEQLNITYITLSVLWDICRRLLSLHGRMYNVYNLVPPLTPSAVTGFVVKGLRRLLPVSASEMSTKSDVKVALNSDTNRILKKADLYLNHIWKCFKRIRFAVVKKNQIWFTWGGPNQIQGTWACTVNGAWAANKCMLVYCGRSKGENPTNMRDKVWFNI